MTLRHSTFFFDLKRIYLCKPDCTGIYSELRERTELERTERIRVGMKRDKRESETERDQRVYRASEQRGSTDKE